MVCLESVPLLGDPSRRLFAPTGSDILHLSDLVRQVFLQREPLDCAAVLCYLLPSLRVVVFFTFLQLLIILLVTLVHLRPLRHDGGLGLAGD